MAGRHKAHIAHQTAGRVRLNLPAGKGNKRLLNEISALINTHPGVRRVSANPTTGSIVIHYDSARVKNPASQIEKTGEDSGLFSLEMPEEMEELQEVCEDTQLLAEHSEVARAVVKAVQDLNANIRRATNNAVDLNVLVPLAAAVYSFVERESEAATPLWLTLGIFSFHSFVTLHSHRHDGAQQAAATKM